MKISKRWWTHFDRSLSHAPQFSPFLVWIWKFSSLSLKITRGSHNLFFVPTLPKNDMCLTGAKKKDISATQSTLRNIIFMNLVIFGILNKQFCPTWMNIIDTSNWLCIINYVVHVPRKSIKAMNPLTFTLPNGSLSLLFIFRFIFRGCQIDDTGLQPLPKQPQFCKFDTPIWASYCL